MTIVLTDDVKAMLDEISTLAMARKVVLSQEMKECVDVPPMMVSVLDDRFVCAECDESVDDDDVMGQVLRLLREMYSHPELREFEFMVSVVDSFVRYYDTGDDARRLSVGLADGQLAKEFSSDPLTDVVEGFCVTVFDRTGDVLEAFIEYKRNDEGMPYATDKVTVSDSVKSGQSGFVFDAVNAFVLLCRTSPKSTPPDYPYLMNAEGERVVDDEL